MAEPRTLVEGGISAREAEVLALLAEHLTNAEIGARLYISVRTVESHVSSLLRKLGVSDRRALAQRAAELHAEGAAGVEAGVDPATTASAMTTTAPVLPSPLTSFVGRAAERTALAAALEGHRLVTAVGPGGVGKTRLALMVAADVADRFADGVWYVDLVPVTDPTMIAAAVATGLGLGEQSGRSVEDTLATRLADSEALLVLDNCEHLADGVVLFIERLLARCSRLVVLATSRARLLVPFEWVFPVPGLSLPDDAGDDGDDGEGTDESDAVRLFLERAAAVGSPPLTADEQRRVAGICRSLDGMALAIELAAARLPMLGIDGLEAGLADRLRLLAGGPRLDDRHSSLRATLDWSYGLLDPVDQALLRRVSVFAAPFTIEAAASVAGTAPIDPHDVGEGLARLANQSLLVVVPHPAGTRYRALETIRQYGAAWLDDAGEREAVLIRHLQWCLEVATTLELDTETDRGTWRAAFDAVADDLRAALQWASQSGDRRSEAYDLALSMAGLTFSRGLPGEAQRRFEQAAGLTDDPAPAALALHRAAGAAASRHAGDDAFRLYQATADVARRANDDVLAARDLAFAATLINRGPGLFTELPPEGTVDRLLNEARTLAAGHDEAEAALLTAEGFNGDEIDPVTSDLAERAVERARRIGDPLLESAALDQRTAVQLAHGEIAAGAASAARRVELLAPLGMGPEVGMEVSDALQMAAETSIGAGDLAAARRFAERILELPYYREEGHLATARLLVVEALAGDWDRVLQASLRFLEGWERAGRPRAGNLGMGACAVAMVHGLRGDEPARGQWLAMVAELRSTVQHLAGRRSGYGPVFDAIVALHRGQAERTLDDLTIHPEELRQWHTGLWRQWYAALWAEAAVFAGHADAEARLARARAIAAGNPIAAAMIQRTTAWADGDRASTLAAAAALEAAGCRYQWARTLVLAGGRHRAEGEAALAAMGAQPMAVP